MFFTLTSVLGGVVLTDLLFLDVRWLFTMSRANNYEGGVHGFRFPCARQQTAMCALFLAATGFARDEETPGEVSRNKCKTIT